MRGAESPPSLYHPVITMEPLQELFDLYEATMAKPELKEPGSAAIGTPQADYDDHPVIQDKNKVDALRLSGMSAPDAHEKVKGEV